MSSSTHLRISRANSAGSQIRSVLRLMIRWSSPVASRTRGYWETVPSELSLTVSQRRCPQRLQPALSTSPMSTKPLLPCRPIITPLLCPRHHLSSPNNHRNPRHQLNCTCGRSNPTRPRHIITSPAIPIVTSIKYTHVPTPCPTCLSRKIPLMGWPQAGTISGATLLPRIGRVRRSIGRGLDFSPFLPPPPSCLNTRRLFCACFPSFYINYPTVNGPHLKM